MYKAHSKNEKPREHTLVLRKTTTAPKVDLYHTDNEGKHSFIIALSETVVKNHLHQIRDKLLTMTCGVNSKEVYLSGGPFAAFKFVVDLVIKDGPKTYIRVRDRPLKIAIALFQAVQVLGLDPAQPHIENHIVGHVSHEKLDAEEIAAMDLAFGAAGLENRCWRTMVDHLGWLFVKGKWSEAELEDVMSAIRALLALDRAANENVESLRRLQENRARMKGKRNGEEAAPFSQYHVQMIAASTPPADPSPIRDLGPKMRVAPLISSDRSSAPPTTLDRRFGIPDKEGDQPPPPPAQVMHPTNTIEVSARSLQTDAVLCCRSATYSASEGVMTASVSVVVDETKIGPLELPYVIQRWVNGVAEVVRGRTWTEVFGQQ